jgi:hypothetical protein
MLRGYNRLDYVGKIVDIWKRFYAKEDVIERLFRTGGCVFGGRDN